MDVNSAVQMLRRINLNQLISFLAVSETGSFRGAAARIHLSQSALSVQIRQLEDMLGVPLFHRTTRAVVLTAEGERLVSVTRRAAFDLTQLAVEFQEEAQLQRGFTTMVTLPSLAESVVPHLMTEFATRHPGIHVKLHDANSKMALEKLKRGEVDIGLLSEGDNGGDILFVPLLKEALMAVVPRDGHPLSKRDRVTLRELAAYPLLLNPRGVALREILEMRLLAQGITPAPVQELVGSHALIELVSLGAGVSILPELALTKHTGSCKFIRIQDAGTRDIGLLLPQHRSRSPATEALRSFLHQQLSAKNVDRFLKT